jgi:hypothetical protein
MQMCNPAEVAIVASIVSAAIGRGCAPASIGVISPYRSQLRLLRSALAALGDSVEVWMCVCTCVCGSTCSCSCPASVWACRLVHVHVRVRVRMW